LELDIEKHINLNEKIPEVIDEFKQSHVVFINKLQEIVEKLKNMSLVSVNIKKGLW
jgi:hypothetical protein|tara:strand:- start:287 stop:454 length:168 start_codon:yes stop_codon:yes gene_type:complete